VWYYHIIHLSLDLNNDSEFLSNETG